MTDDVWGQLYDPSDPVHQSLARMSGFHDDPRPETLAEYMDHLRLYLDTKRRIGQAGMELLGPRKVHDRRLKWKLMAEHLRDERSWVSIEVEVGLHHIEQCYVISNGHETPLIGWDEDLQIECEHDIRDGMSAYRVARVYDLPEHQARALVRLFRGPD